MSHEDCTSVVYQKKIESDSWCGAGLFEGSLAQGSTQERRKMGHNFQGFWGQNPSWCMIYMYNLESIMSSFLLTVNSISDHSLATSKVSCLFPCWKLVSIHLGRLAIFWSGNRRLFLGSKPFVYRVGDDRSRLAWQNGELAKSFLAVRWGKRNS